MSITIALAGNPNSGKTTMFNDLTGSNQYVGNWPGVTVEKKEGKLKGHTDVLVQDLPGIYSLSPYTLEEVVARDYLLNENPDVIINIIDGTNLERNLYLSTQLMELGIPIIVALNMIDVVRKRGDIINIEALSKTLNCEIVETSALKGDGSKEVAEKAIAIAKAKKKIFLPCVFDGVLEHAIAHIEESISDLVPPHMTRWHAIKLFERDEKVQKKLALTEDLQEHIEEHIKECEEQMDDDAESIVTSQRYAFISKYTSTHVKKKPQIGGSTSDKIDNIITNRFLALPIFAAVIFLLYYIAVTSLGGYLTDVTNDVIIGQWVLGNMSILFEYLNVSPWLTGLVIDGIIGGVGAVLGFVPQILLVSFLLAILEDVGYMSRIAFIMDRIFHKFGLSGKSFIPMLVGSGCGIPGVMASRTVESESDRRMTILTTTFVPCGAKLPLIALIAGALFNGAWWVAPSAYFIGIGAIIVSGITLKKCKMFASAPTPFVMELPRYHLPAMANILLVTWERGWSFVKRAGTIILISAVVLWFLQNYAFINGALVAVEDNNTSLLAVIGNIFAPIFSPLGFGTWQATVGTVTGLIAKENIVGTLGVLYGFSEVTSDGMEYWGQFKLHFSTVSAYSFLVFNLLCAPCFAAIGAIKQEMNNPKWTIFAVTYQCVLAYVVSLIIYQLGSVFILGTPFGAGAVIAILFLITILYGLFRKNPYAN